MAISPIVIFILFCICCICFFGCGLCLLVLTQEMSPSPAPGPAPGPSPAQKRVYADNGAASCTRYCGGVNGAPWNNELPVAWGGATCVSAGKSNNLACSYVGADPATPGQLECLCQQSPSTPWSTGSFGSATGTGPGT